MKHITKTLLSLLTLCSHFAAHAETLTVEGELSVDNTPSDSTDLPLFETQPGALTIQGGNVIQGGSQRSGAIFRMGNMTVGAARTDTGASHFQWFTGLHFTDYEQKVVYIYLGEFPFQMWGYFDITVTSDYWGPSGVVGRGAITKRHPIAYNTYGAISPGNLHSFDAESSVVIAAAGGIVDYVTIGEAEIFGTQLRVPIYFKAGTHSLAAISVSGMFTRAYNEAGYPYAEIESNSDSIVLDNAIGMRDIRVDGSITFADGTSISSTDGLINSGLSKAYKLTTPDESADVIVVDSNGDTTVSGSINVSGTITMATAQGDISMGLFTAE